MWQDEYINQDGGLYRYLNRDGDDPEVVNYEIIFDFDGQRYYCYVDAKRIDEALGIFYRNHDTVRYKDIVDYFET